MINARAKWDALAKKKWKQKDKVRWKKIISKEAILLKYI